MSKRFLVVDDCEIFRLILSDLVETLGGVVVGQASDGKGGVALFKELAPDIVLLDVDMPNENGLSALMEIRDMNPAALVIMCSGMQSSAIIEQCLAFGAADYLHKDKLEEAAERIGKFIPR